MSTAGRVRGGSAGCTGADQPPRWRSPTRPDTRTVWCPPTCRGMCLQVAARTFTNPAQVRSEQLGAYTVTNTVPGTGEVFGVLLTDVERRTLRRRYGRTSSTVTPAVA